ncbi:MAG: GTPase, partial [Mariprofundaceae bacterium]
AGIRILELKLMADVGLVGLPNAGKSTLLARISNARPKIADYPFTTLAPKLGQVFTDDGGGFVVADIPGLIAGAHQGKGLGDRFLRHVERTTLLLHLVDGSDARGLAEQVREIEAELQARGGGLADKPRMLVVNKIDALDTAARTRLEEAAAGLGLPFRMISAVSGEGVPELLRAMHARLRTGNGDEA